MISMGRLRKLSKGRNLGKYRLIKLIGEGSFGEVWRAKDLVEGIDVALKIPHSHWVTKEHRRIFQDEVKLVASLDHHNILKIKTADVIEKRFIIVTKCAKESLADRMSRPKHLSFIIAAMSQILNALAYAHRHKILHRDIKPENILIFEDGTIRITDFGIARICERTLVRGEGTGTLGYMAPEQAYGQTSYASDVFSVGVLFYEMLTGKLPPWPFSWPYPNHVELKQRLPEPMMFIIKKASHFNPSKRFPDCVTMEKSWMRALKQWRKTKRKKSKKHQHKKKKPLDWREYKIKAFLRQHRAQLKLRFACHKCDRPIGELMRVCPWCGDPNNSFRKISTFPSYCDKCEHGIHNDWRYCPWCFGGRFHRISSKTSKDKRYTEHCTNPRCRKSMMPFMQYCPYCHKKVLRPWHHEALKAKCPHCRWSVTKDYWDFCCWCGTKLGRK